MAAEVGKNLAGLIEDLEARGPEFSVFQAIRIAETASGTAHPDRDDSKCEQKGLNFRPYEQYVFPTRDIRSFSRSSDLMTFVLTYMGLYGIDSPLPRCYHEQIALQQGVHGPGNVALQNFLDIFDTRLYWLYYLAWKKYRYHLQISESPGNLQFRRVFAFVGPLEAFFGRHPGISRFKLLQLSGLLSQRNRSAAGLRLLLREFFPKFGFKIREFVPHRVELSDLPKLGRKHRDRAYRLSRQCVVGRSMTDVSGRIRLDIGPLDFQDFLEFTPRGASADLLRDLLRLYLPDGLEVDLAFTIRSGTIERVRWDDLRLGLGISVWLGRPKAECVSVFYSHERYAGAAAGAGRRPGGASDSTGRSET